jgi:hypothetical protein
MSQDDYDLGYDWLVEAMYSDQPEEPLTPEEEKQRPKKRADCENGQRPCPWLTCCYHLALCIDEHGTLQINPKAFTGKDCALDLAEEEHSLEEVSGAFGLTKECIRQIEIKYLHKMFYGLHEREIKRNEAPQPLKKPGGEHATKDRSTQPNNKDNSHNLPGRRADVLPASKGDLSSEQGREHRAGATSRLVPDSSNDLSNGRRHRTKLRPKQQKNRARNSKVAVEPNAIASAVSMGAQHSRGGETKVERGAMKPNHFFSIILKGDLPEVQKICRLAKKQGLAPTFIDALQQQSQFDEREGRHDHAKKKEQALAFLQKETT